MLAAPYIDQENTECDGGGPLLSPEHHKANMLKKLCSNYFL